MIIEFIEKKEREKIKNILNERFGITHLPEVLLKSGKDKIRTFTGNLNEYQIKQFNETIFIEGIGLYIANSENSEELRLTMDGILLLQNQIKKGFYELTDNEFKKWMHGEDIEKENSERGFRIMKYKDYLLGMGKLSEKKISNFIPKNRRIRG